MISAFVSQSEKTGKIKSFVFIAETWPEVIEFASNIIKMIDRYKMMIQRSLF